MHFIKSVLHKTGLLTLFLAMFLPIAVASPNISGLTDYQRMSWLFYHANRDTIPVSAAATHFDKLHAENTPDYDRCVEANQLAKDRVINVKNEYKRKFYSLHNAINPAKLSDRFDATISIPNAYESYDRPSKTLIVNIFNHLPDPLVIDAFSATKYNYKKKHIYKNFPCIALPELETSTNTSTSFPLPGRFQIDLYSALRKSIVGDNHLVRLPDIQSSLKFRHIPMRENIAFELLNRPSIDRNMEILVNYKFRPRHPHRETSASGRRNQFIRTNHTSYDYSLPTHSVDIVSITYIDKLSRNILQEITLDEYSITAHPIIQRHRELQTSPTESTTPAKLSDTRLPKGLRLFEGAIVVRTDDLVFHKTSARNRYALTKLNQQLVLSAGLPDLSNPENGIYIADILGDRASEYFIISDMRTVQPQTYNLLLDGADQGQPVATKWRDDVSKDWVLESFRKNEIPRLQNFTLGFPIDFIVLREVLAQAYDIAIGGFPLLFTNGNSNMRLNDLRKPSIRLDANLPKTLPDLWKLNLGDAEYFIEKYYRYHADRNDNGATGALKRLTLASHYKMLSVKPRHNTVVANMELQQHSLYLSDELNYKLDDLHIHPDN